MVVKTQCNGREVTGLCVGSTNARRYFSRNLKSVELHLGDLRIQCNLAPDFWQGRADIHDPRLCDRSRKMVPVPMALEQFGMNSFKLTPSANHTNAAAPRDSRYAPAF
jgi:hypothetical protein